LHAFSFGVGRHLHLDHAIGIRDGAALTLALLELVDRIHSGDDLADHGVYLPLRNAPSPNMMKNWLFAEFGSLVRAMPTMPRVNGELVNSAGRLGYVDPPVPSPLWPSPVLRHEPGDDPMERDVCRNTVARQRLEALGVLGGRDRGRSLRTIRPYLVSMRIVFCGSRPAGSGWAMAGAAQTSTNKTANTDERGVSWSSRDGYR